MTNPSKKTLITDWIEVRKRQAKDTSRIATGFAGTTAVLSLAFAISVFTGKTDAAKAATALGLTSTAAATFCFKLSDDANKRYDAAMAEFLDENNSK